MLKQKKKKLKEKNLLLPTVWKGDLSKTPPYHRASSLWAYMRIFTPSLWSLWTEDTDVLLQRTSSVFFAKNQSDVNRCLYLEERRFFPSDSDNL